MCFDPIFSINFRRAHASVLNGEVINHFPSHRLRINLATIGLNYFSYEALDGADNWRSADGMKESWKRLLSTFLIFQIWQFIQNQGLYVLLIIAFLVDETGQRGICATHRLVHTENMHRSVLALNGSMPCTIHPQGTVQCLDVIGTERLAYGRTATQASPRFKDAEYGRKMRDPSEAKKCTSGCAKRVQSNQRGKFRQKRPVTCGLREVCTEERAMQGTDGEGGYGTSELFEARLKSLLRKISIHDVQ
ncbi:hypothetical protein B0H13DRAFT_1869872 [Mycena leptocephala]|nr:hypothetical protein B0H13DRAFT_1869872 [Mycena leptocephala]